MKLRIFTPIAATVLVFGLAACDDNQANNAAENTTSTQTTSEKNEKDSTQEESLNTPKGDEASDEKDANSKINTPFKTPPIVGNNFPEYPSQPRRIVDVRIGKHEGYSRLVVEFSEPTVNKDRSEQSFPAYDIRYAKEVKSMGKGATIKLPGNIGLAIKLVGIDLPASEISKLPAAYNDFGAAGIIRGGQVAPPFEAMAQIAVGVEEQVPLRVFELENPARLVIDFKSN